MAHDAERGAHSGLQKLAPVDAISPSGTSGAQTGISILSDGDDQAPYLQPALER